MSTALPPLRHFELDDADPTLLAGRRVAILGYGNQGRAHALNLRDSGVEVVVGLREGSRRREQAARDGFVVKGLAEAATGAFIVMVLVPDEVHGEVYREQIEPVMSGDSHLAFAHGFSMAFGLVTPPPQQSTLLVAPKGQGDKLREAFLAGGGLPGLIGVQGPDPGESLKVALAYARACGALAGGGLLSSFREEAVTDLFGEQVVLCGGMVELITAAWETLVGRGYSPEGAYFECLHEVKIIADLIHQRGVDGMREGISTTAAYGGLKAAPRIITEETRRTMEGMLDEIESGDFARAFLAEQERGSPWLESMKQNERDHPMQKTGRRLRDFLRRCQLDGGTQDGSRRE